MMQTSNHYSVVKNLSFSFIFLVFAASLTFAEQRIVTLSPAIAEMVSQVQTNTDSIVGVTEYSDSPKSLKDKPSVGPYFRVNIEKIISLKPSLIIATDDGNNLDQIARLKELKQNVVVLKAAHLADIAENYRVLGRLLNANTEGEARAAGLEKKILMLKTRFAVRANQKKYRILLQVGENPLVTIGRVGFLADILNVVSAENIFSDLSQAYPKVSREDVVKRRPDRIVFLSLSQQPDESEQVKRVWKSVGLPNVKVLTGDRVVRPTDRVVEGIEQLASVIYDSI